LGWSDGAKMQHVRTHNHYTKCIPMQPISNSTLVQNHMNMNRAVRDSLVREGLLYLCFSKTTECEDTKLKAHTLLQQQHDPVHAQHCK